MARFFKYSYILFFILLLFPACQNEGNIGDLYGQWALKKSSVNGVIKDHDQIYFSFQGKVVWAKNVNASNHTYDDVFGNFCQKGDSILINFVQKGDILTPASLIEEICGFSDAANVRLLIKNLNSSELILLDGDSYWCFDKF